MGRERERKTKVAEGENTGSYLVERWASLDYENGFCLQRQREVILAHTLGNRNS